nr:RluA family pseudouridine synthase [uncultured Niameybacter sp.]
MTRKLHYKIEEQDKGKSIGSFLKEKDYSRGVIIELKKIEGGIKKNSVPAGVNEILEIGDVLDICLVEEDVSKNIVPRAYDLDILYEDEDILVVNKPYNMPIHPSVNNYDNTLANGIMYYYKKQGESYVFRCMNRLDRDTSGVTIIAKNLLSGSILSKQMKEKGIDRIYIAFVEGITKEEGTIDLPIGREEGTIIKRKIDEKEGKTAITHYRRLEVIHIDGKDVSVVALKLETGRTHQIRVHMTAISHPLLGDFLYNEDNHMLTRQGLHGIECSFYHPITREYMKIKAPLPNDMSELLECSFNGGNESETLINKLQNLKW